MTFFSSRWLRLSRIVLPVSLALFLLGAYLYDPNLISISQTSWIIPVAVGSNENSNDRESDIPITREDFIREAAAWEINGPYDDGPLRDLCAGASWQEGLVVKCEEAFGGVGNIKNIVLTCIRYAIEAGATSLIIPKIEARDEGLIDLHTSTTFPLTYLFDEDFLAESLAAACPRINVLPHENLLDPAIQKAILLPKQLGTKFKIERVIDFASEWRSLFDKWVSDFGAPDGFSSSKPLLVTIRASLFEFPILHDSASFIATFGRIIRFRSSFLRLAANVLYILDTEYNLAIDPAKIGQPGKGKYYGAHLRTDTDAIAANFATYEEQSKAYLEEAQKLKMSLIYVASGMPSDTEKFTKAAAEKGIKVTTKFALLKSRPEFADILQEIKALSWDQQALIDYMILLRSSHFGGTWASSFSYNIVFQRHVVVGGGKWVPSKLALNTRGLDLKRRWGSNKDELEEGQCYRDSISTVFGPFTMGLWFQLTMWP